MISIHPWVSLVKDYGVDTMKITDDDAAFILGKGGRTKEKISKVSGGGTPAMGRDGKVRVQVGY